MDSFAISAYSISVPLCEAIKKFGKAKQTWKFGSETAFFESLMDADLYEQGKALCDSKELSTVATYLIVEYKDWCSKHRTLCSLKSMRDTDVAIASYLDVNLKWKVKPEHNRKGYIHGYNNLVFDRKQVESAGKESSFRIQTSDPDSMVYIKKGCMSENILDLPCTIQAWMSKHEKNFSSASFTSLVIPMIDYENPVDLSSLLQAHFVDKDGDQRYLNEVQTMVSLILDDNGVRVKAEFHALGTKSIPRIIAVEEPFTFWIMRKGFDLPVVAAYLSYDSWQESH